jgi:predicted DNA-binding protein (MmcQ/YjbR family)
MTLAQLRAYCLSLPHTTEEIQWEEHLLFKIGGKMYVITTPADPNVPLSLKCTPEEFNELVEREGIGQAPYFARNMWVKLEHSNALSAAELKGCIRRSYDLVLAKLPKKLQAELSR